MKILHVPIGYQTEVHTIEEAVAGIFNGEAYSYNRVDEAKQRADCAADFIAAILKRLSAETVEGVLNDVSYNWKVEP